MFYDFQFILIVTGFIIRSNLYCQRSNLLFFSLLPGNNSCKSLNIMNEKNFVLNY